MAYDIIGDVHGQAGKLKALLRRLGYAERNGAWRHSDPLRTAVFVGDYIDRGPEQVETIEIVRRMVDAGTARAVMGNHELNAIAWVTEKRGGKPGEYLRAGKEHKRPQHQAFLDAVGEGSAKHMQYVEWFKTLPLFLDLGEIRVVHAWWHPPHLAVAESRADKGALLNEELLHAIHDRGSPESIAVQEMCKGMEADLPAGCRFSDKDGISHGNVRLKWWETTARTFKDAAIGPPDAIKMVPEVPLPAGLLPGLDSEVPVFIGHYWFTSEPAPLTEKLACLDYAAAVGNRPLMAYRWDGEKILDKSGFVGSH
jgi:hypothetical protein